MRRITFLFIAVLILTLSVSAFATSSANEEIALKTREGGSALDANSDPNSVTIALNPGNVLCFYRPGGFDSEVTKFILTANNLPLSPGWFHLSWTNGSSYGSSRKFVYAGTDLDKFQIEWLKRDGTKSWLGTTRSGYSEIGFVNVTNEYFYICNPVGCLIYDEWVGCPPISLTFDASNFESIHIVPLICWKTYSFIPLKTDPDYRSYGVNFSETGEITYTDSSGKTVPAEIANRFGGIKQVNNSEFSEF